MKYVKGIMAASALVVSTLLGAATASAQSYPERTVTIVTGYAAGGPMDIAARGLAQKLSALWGAAVVVENKPGANEINATTAVVKAEGDGYTLLFAADSAAGLNPALFSKLPYDAEKDLAPISRLFQVNMGLVVPKSLPADDLASFVELMKADGSKYNYGSSSIGSTTHIGFEAIKQALGFQMTQLAYQGIAPALKDMLSGSVHAMIAGLSAFAPHVTAGNVKVLAVSGDTRWSALPNVPTFKELGHPEIVVGFYGALFAPAGTPQTVIDKLSAGVRAAQDDPDFAARFFAPYDYLPIRETPAEFAKFLQEDRARAKSRIEAGNIQKLN